MEAEQVRYDAIFAANDAMAIGAMQALREQGKSIPHDVSVVGCDDIEMAGITNPPLTSVYQSMRQVGTLAAQKLIALLNGEPVAARNTIVPHRLVVRESCGGGKGKFV